MILSEGQPYFLYIIEKLWTGSKENWQYKFCCVVHLSYRFAVLIGQEKSAIVWYFFTCCKGCLPIQIYHGWLVNRGNNFLVEGIVEKGDDYPETNE